LAGQIRSNLPDITNAFMLSGKWFFFSTILFSSQLVFAQTATIKAQTAAIRGNVYDAISRDGLPGAYVAVNKTDLKRAANDKGNFEISGLAPGEYDVTIENIGYASITRHIVLHAGETFRLFAALNQNSKSLDEVTVVGRSDREQESGSRDREKYAVNITNVISSQAMARSPDINAANVLQRMSGITVQRSSGGDEAYAVIRGMEPRYNNTLVNGIKIASPDSKNRFVQLDIIPSDILSSIEIHKSLTPDMEGDAIGGTVNMVVKDAPQAASFKMTGSIGYSQLFFDEKYIDFQKSGIQRLSPVQRHYPGYIPPASDFPRSNLDFQPRQAPPTGTFGFSYTRRFMHDKIGVVLADNVQNQYYGNISSRANTTNVQDPTTLQTTDALRYLDLTNYRGYTQQLNNGLVAHIDYAFSDRNRLSIDNFYIYSYLAQSRLSEDTTLLGTGRVGPGTGQVFPSDQSAVQRQHVENLKVAGQHVLVSKDNSRGLQTLSLDWAGVLSDAARHVPDLSSLGLDYLIKPDYTRTVTHFDGVSQDWLNNDDKDYSGLVNLDYHKKSKGQDLQLKAGGLYRTKTRYNNEDDYVLHGFDTSAACYGCKPVWSNIYSVYLTALNTTGTGTFNLNNYKASEIVYAEYLMARYQTDKWEAGGGLRVENTSTDWKIRVQVQTAASSGNQTYQDFLPSAFLKLKLSAKQNLHFSYNRSISRPNYYELVPTGNLDIASSSETSGNPFLLHSVADNFDLRYEIFPKGEQNLFLGVFYKNIKDPIELQVAGISGGNTDFALLNSPTATNYGAELAFTQYWGKFGITGNYTYTHSAITSLKHHYDKTGTKVPIYETRPMQGQTDHVVNLSLLYKDPRKGVFAQLAYGYQGKTLSQIQEIYQSDYYQRPMNTLAFSLEKDIHKHFTVFGKFNNLLNTPSVQYVQKTLEVSRDVYRATYSIGFRYAR
jgi:TonB-dependent receptor